MRIDNSAFSCYSKCPKLYFERYEATDFVGGKDGTNVPRVLVRGGEAETAVEGAGSGQALLPILSSASPGIELDKPSEGRDFGTRIHQLLHRRRLVSLFERGALALGQADFDAQLRELDREWPDEDIEAEAQSTLAAYEAHYVRDYEYLESERTSILSLPRRCPDCWEPGVECPDGQWYCKPCGRFFTGHELVVKLDAVVRHRDGTIGPMDTKTELKPGYNTREDWAGRTQAKLYLFALTALYPDEHVSRLVVDVVTRRSPKARREPVFTRLDDIQSTPEAIEEAIRNVVQVADEIEQSRRRGWWKSNMNICKKGWEICDYYDIHVYGRTSKNLAKYKPAEDYLSLND